MNSEKVKKIKKALECCTNLKEKCDNEKCYLFNKLEYHYCERQLKQDILTLINELEREKENLINKRYEEFENFGIQWENDENNKKRKTNKYLKNFSMELLLYYQQQYTNNQQLKDRIALLEKDNETLRNAKVVYENVDYCYEDLKKAEKKIAELEKGNEALSFAVKQGFNDCQAKTLKQFAERLKEKLEECSPFVGFDLEDLEFDGETIQGCIDETLKEFLK